MRRRRQADGTVVEIAETFEGVRDKRLLLVEEEFSRVLRLARMEGSTLSPTIREAWDSDTLMTTAKTAPARASGAHVVILGHITPEELRRELRAAEISNGFANRFLFASSRRSKHLSSPPRLAPEVRASLVEKLQRVKAFVDALPEDGTRVESSPEALRLWCTMKREVEEEAEWAEAAGLLLAKVITRGAPYVLRLAALYAVLGEGLVVEPEHLQAAREVWCYSVDSPRVIFGDAVEHPDARRVLEALAAGEGRKLARGRIHEALGGRRSAEDLTRLRDLLICAGKIEPFLDRPANGRLDVAVTNKNQAAQVLLNRMPPRGNWIVLDLRAPTPNVFAVHAGLGAAGRVDQVLVRWPDGARETLENPPVNQRLRLVKGSGKPTST